MKLIYSLAGASLSGLALAQTQDMDSMGYTMLHRPDASDAYTEHGKDGQCIPGIMVEFLDDDGNSEMVETECDDCMDLDCMKEKIMKEIAAEQDDDDAISGDEGVDGRAFNNKDILMAATILAEDPNFLPELKNVKKKRKALSSQLSNYGCWCGPHKRYTGFPRNGLTVDPVDQACKNLYQCQRCLPIENGPNCNGDKGRYFWDFDETTGATCSHKRNTAQCQTDKCLCAKRFADDIASIWMSPDYVYDASFWLNRRIRKMAKKRGTTDQLFKFRETCENMVPNPHNALSCCGTFPNITPFDSSTKDCCRANRAYDVVMQDCCSDGRVVSVIEGCV